MASQHGGATAEEFISDTDESTYRAMLQEALQQNWAGGFCQMPDAVRNDRALSPKAKIVYEQLLSYMWFHSDHCWPSQQTLADATGYSRRTVIRACKELYERGYIEKWRRGQGHSNYYFINPLSFPRSFRRTTREPAESMILDVHAPERLEVCEEGKAKLFVPLTMCHFGTSARDTVSHPEVTTCHRNQTKENQSHGKEMDSNLSSLPPKGRDFPVAVQTTRNEHEEHVQTTAPQGEEQSALQTWRNAYSANQPYPAETQRHSSESRKHHDKPVPPSKKPNSSARSCSQGTVPGHAKDAKDDTRCEHQTKQASLAAKLPKKIAQATGIPEGHLEEMEIAQVSEKRRSIPACIKDIISRYSRELGDNDWCIKSNITRAAKLYFFLQEYVTEPEVTDNPEGFFEELLYQAKQASYHINNVRYRNDQGRINRMPVFFTCLENRFELSDAELDYIRSDELLFEPSW